MVSVNTLLAAAAAGATAEAALRGDGESAKAGVPLPARVTTVPLPNTLRMQTSRPYP
jgi:hypothetical protein